MIEGGDCRVKWRKGRKGGWERESERERDGGVFCGVGVSGGDDVFVGRKEEEED